MAKTESKKVKAKPVLAGQALAILQILQNLPDAVLAITTEKHICYANEQAEKMFGKLNESYQDIQDLFPPKSGFKTNADWQARFEHFKTNHQTESFDTQMIGVTENLFDVRISQTPILNEKNELLGVSIVIKDLSQRIETEQRISRRNAQMFALIDVAEATTSVFEVRNLLEKVLDAVLRVTSLNSGCVHVLNREDESLEIIVHENFDENFTNAMSRFELGEGVIGQTAVLAETIIVNNTANDRRIVRQIAAETFGALAAIPLIGREGNVRGVLTLFHQIPREFTAHEVSMLTGIGKQVGVALERAELLSEVTNARQEWEQTFDSMTDGVSIHAPSGKIRRANDSLAKMFGKNADELVGIRCCELYHGSKKPRQNCTIMRTVTERRAQKVELTDQNLGRVLRVITDPIISLSGRIVGVVCTTRDVTDEKLFERRLIQQERISAIGEITAGIAHEVGTPLNIISANVEYLTRTNQALIENEEVQAIQEQTKNIAQLVHQLLDFSRDRSPEFAPVNVNNLITKTLGLLNHQLQKSNVQVKLNLAQYLPTVDGDVSQIQQVLFNLITNARQALEGIDNDRILEIETDTAFSPTERFDRPHIVIKIRDNGVGIAEEDLPNVFNPFFTANKEGGTGLGLAISYRIIQRHLGLLILENNYDKGVLAKIKLPLAQN